MSLGVCIDNQNPLPTYRKTCANMNSECRFSNPTLFVQKRYNLHCISLSIHLDYTILCHYSAAQQTIAPFGEFFVYTAHHLISTTRTHSIRSVLLSLTLKR